MGEAEQLADSPNEGRELTEEKEHPGIKDSYWSDLTRQYTVWLPGAIIAVEALNFARRNDLKLPAEVVSRRQGFILLAMTGGRLDMERIMGYF